MSLAYRIMYRVGSTPWDTGEVVSELKALVEGADALAPELEVAARFNGCAMASKQPDAEPGPAGPLRNVPRTWYRLVRQ